MKSVTHVIPGPKTFTSQKKTTSFLRKFRIGCKALLRRLYKIVSQSVKLYFIIVLYANGKSRALFAPCCVNINTVHIVYIVYTEYVLATRGFSEVRDEVTEYLRTVYIISIISETPKKLHVNVYVHCDVIFYIFSYMPLEDLCTTHTHTTPYSYKTPMVRFFCSWFGYSGLYSKYVNPAKICKIPEKFLKTRGKTVRDWREAKKTEEKGKVLIFSSRFFHHSLFVGTAFFLTCSFFFFLFHVIDYSYVKYNLYSNQLFQFLQWRTI